MLSLSIRKLCTHSQSSYGVYTRQAHLWFQIFKFSREIIFFILTLSTHVSRFTLHTVIWFTLSKHMLGSKFSNFHERSFFMLTLSTHVSGFTLHTVIWFTLSKHMLCSKFSNFHERSFFHTYTLHTCFRVHSPYSYLVYTLQAHVRFKIFKFYRSSFLDFHRISFFSYLPLFFHTYHTLHSCFRVHSPCSCFYTLQADVTFHSCFRVHSPCSCVYTLQTDVSKFYIVIIISSCA